MGRNIHFYDAKRLDLVCRGPPSSLHCVSDHATSEVVIPHANMGGAGGSIFEHDFSIGTGMISEVHRGPYAQERLEIEVASSRLRGAVRGIIC